MLQHALAILGLGALCGGWVLLQRWITRHDPAVKGPESGCTSCSCGHGSCRNQVQEPRDVPGTHDPGSR